MTKGVIIVAGGKGTRMGTELPKQFLLLCGRPVLMHTIEAFYSYDSKIEIIVVLPQEEQDHWKKICEKYDFFIPHQIVSGGETRFHSVRNGLEVVDTRGGKNDLIAVHDGVRPLVTQEVIGRCFEKAQKSGGAFPIIPVVDTIRKKNGNVSMWVDRKEYSLVQTPQVFRFGIIQEAYDQEFSEQFTDDVSVVEALEKYRIDEIKGDRCNIKITTPADLILAEGIIKIKESEAFTEI